VTCPTFAEGIRFVDRVAVEADARDHHPDIDIRYTAVTLALSTHSAGGLTRQDFDLAGRIDQLAG
jgi:4a-hydroxytetrahydrobiopterin dehydratase